MRERLTYSCKWGAIIILILILSSSHRTEVLANWKIAKKPANFNGTCIENPITQRTSSRESTTKITSLFVRAHRRAYANLTMLIAYDSGLTQIVREIFRKPVTPLVFSVSTMPFVTAEFRPELLQFEQDGRWWSPSNDEDSLDMFPLGEDINFGGIINDSEVQQGIICLPGWFDINKPIKIQYKKFKRIAYLR